MAKTQLNQFPRNTQVLNPTVTISSGGTTSNAYDLDNMTLCGLFMPATFTGGTVSFTASTAIDGTFVPVYDGAGTLLSKTVAAAEYIKLYPADFAGIRFIKIVSGASEGADRIITLAGRKIE